MRRRLYFLLPDLAAAKQVVDDLLLARIGIRHTHVLARRGSDLDDLPEANIPEDGHRAWRAVGRRRDGTDHTSLSLIGCFAQPSTCCRNAP